MHKLYAQIKYAGKTYVAELLIRNDADGKKYLYDIQKIKIESSSSLPASLIKKIRHIRSNSLIDSLAQTNDVVNPESEKNIRFSRAENNSARQNSLDNAEESKKAIEKSPQTGASFLISSRTVDAYRKRPGGAFLAAINWAMPG